MSRSDILRFYAEAAGVRPDRGKQQRALHFPADFCVFKEPDNVLQTLEEFVGMVLGGANFVGILQENCRTIGHAAESVFNALAMEASARFKTSFAGRFPQQEEQMEIVLATGLPRCLKVPVPEPRDFFTFPLRKGAARRSMAQASAPRDVIGSDLTKYIDDCLGFYNAGLSPRGLEYLGSILGEILTNCENHAERPEWWIAGYLRRGKAYGDCHITIFNFGRTIAEGLRRLEPESLLRRRMDELVGLHHERAFFGRDWTPEGLWTLYALQEGVSRFNQGPQSLGDTRGVGTADAIEFFQTLGRTKHRGKHPTMCIISGQTQIIIDGGKHQLRLQTTPEGEERRIIAFNRKNDLRFPPDRGAVRKLRRFFPGTLISMDFFLDPTHLVKLS